MMIWFITLLAGFLYGKVLVFIMQHLSLKGPFYLRISPNPYFIKPKFALFYQILPFFCALLFISALLLLPNQTHFFIFIILATYAFLLSFYDIHYFLLPDYLIISLFITGALFSYYGRIPVPLPVCLTMALVLGTLLYLANLFFYIIRNVWGMGLGDIKLMMALTAWFTPMQMIYIVILSTSSALLWIIIIWLIKRKTLLKIPFGPFILFGSWTILLYN